jgi:hemerythrin superfamily protein
LQQSETDDDQALDEFFEGMMQTVRAHFVTEERDLFPLVESSLDTSPF